MMENENTMRRELISMVNAVLAYLPWGEISPRTAADVADCLIKNGVIIPVRCAECHNFTKSMWCNLLMMNVKAEWFCSQGKRIENERQN